LYQTYIPQAVSHKIDCRCLASQNTPSHSHVITLIENALNTNDELFFRSCMNLLKFICALDKKVKDKLGSYPKEAPYFVDSMLGVKYDGNFVIKTPLWAIQHCLSMNNPSKKSYVIEFSSAEELSTAADGAFIICGYLNPECSMESSGTTRVDHPHDPSYKSLTSNSQQNSVPTVVLYMPSTGTYYSPYFYPIQAV